ncbi:hypothetical protein Psi01_57440 [Planobispora siamensis]|uniref:DUF1707 domain-containing protein n=2 Tax=Planobispora siamensis TaxID=936338 RepID=A0A8J3SKV8_9ACTN|nr:hypothetical protein Psi01_57440 [Planobispora siamensis]
MLRAGDRDRERIAEMLRLAVGEGRISVDELTERLDRVYGARTFGELDAVVADLPEAAGGLSRPAAPPVSRSHSSAPGSQPALPGDVLRLHTRGTRAIRQVGRWTVPRQIIVDCTWRTAVIDFRQAACPHREVDMRVECHSPFGDVIIRVPIGWQVVSEEMTSGGWVRLLRVHNRPPEPLGPDGVVVRLSGHISGDVWVRYRR